VPRESLEILASAVMGSASQRRGARSPSAARLRPCSTSRRRWATRRSRLRRDAAEARDGTRRKREQELLRALAVQARPGAGRHGPSESATTRWFAQLLASPTELGSNRLPRPLITVRSWVGVRIRVRAASAGPGSPDTLVD